MMTTTRNGITVDDLFKFNYRPLCLYALHYINDPEMVEDIVQDSFTAVWEKINHNKEITNIRAYLYTSVRNRCLDLIKKGSKEISIENAHHLYEQAEEQLQEDSGIEARLWTAIDALPDKRREIFIMNKRDGLKYAEIAEKLGISINTVKNQISKALDTLRNGAIQIYQLLFCW